MRILTVSDKVEPVLYGPYIRERVGRIDLVLACGDLPDYYLEYIVGLLDVPLYFVHGNHDAAPAEPSGERATEDAGDALSWGANLHRRHVAYRGLLIGGLEGCRRYSPGRPYQYTEREAWAQVLGLGGRLLANRARHGRYLDIFLTHAPPRGIHDAEDLPHQGFASYRWFLRVFRPLLHIHGHQHIYDRNKNIDAAFASTRVLNTYGYRVLELSATGRGWELTAGSR